MHPQTIGEFTVQSVIEHVAPYIAATEMLPSSTPEALAEHMDWMAPTHIDPATGFLIMAFQSFVLQTPNHTILIDTCVGEDKSVQARIGT